jgi:hypothetical protein
VRAGHSSARSRSQPTLTMSEQHAVLKCWTIIGRHLKIEVLGCHRHTQQAGRSTGSEGGSTGSQRPHALVLTVVRVPTWCVAVGGMVAVMAAPPTMAWCSSLSALSHMNMIIMQLCCRPRVRPGLTQGDSQLCLVSTAGSTASCFSGKAKVIDSWRLWASGQCVQARRMRGQQWRGVSALSRDYLDSLLYPPHIRTVGAPLSSHSGTPHQVSFHLHKLA